MDFSFTEEQQMLQESVQKFVQKNYDFDARNAILESAKGYSEENWKLFAELGWLTVPFSEQDGGFGGSAVDLMIMMEEFGKAMLVEPFLPTTVLAGGLIAGLGSAEQKEDLLPKIMEGKLQLALAFAETDSRFNPGSIKTTAVSADDSVTINGSKVAVLNGPNADKIIVIARNSGETRDNEGISAYLVDASAAGVAIHSYANIDGQMAAQINFSNVKVPLAALLGEEGQALLALVKVIDNATLGVSAQAVGAIDALLQKTVEYSKTRKQFGVPIGSFQALQHRMADMFIECQLAKSIVIMAAMKLDGDTSELEKAKAVSAAKSRVGKAILKVGQEAIQIHGGIGMTEELDVGHLFKHVTALDILFGNADYHTLRFAKL